MNDSSMLPAMLFGVLGLVILVIVLAIAVLVAWLLYRPLARIPEQYRTINPMLAWLTVIPLVNIVMVWILAPFAIPQSFRNYFDANPQGNTDVGDCGKAIGLAWAICIIAGFVPILGIFASLAGIVLMILYLVKVNGLMNRIPATA